MKPAGIKSGRFSHLTIPVLIRSDIVDAPRHRNAICFWIGQAMAKIGICHICGLSKELTEEHVPPQAALNSGYFYLATVEQAINTGPEPFREGPRYQGGIRFETLCADCNNRECNRYNRELIRWI